MCDVYATSFESGAMLFRPIEGVDVRFSSVRRLHFVDFSSKCKVYVASESSYDASTGLKNVLNNALS
jgi:hypothetical protein